MRLEGTWLGGGSYSGRNTLSEEWSLRELRLVPVEDWLLCFQLELHAYQRSIVRSHDQFEVLRIMMYSITHNTTK